MKQKRPKYMQIIDAAVEVIAENGYHQSQVSKIAKQAGVADGTIYLYFKNKEDILISLFKEKMGQFIERMEEDIKEKTTAKEKLALVISKHFSLLAGDHNLAIVTQLELRQSNLELRQKINEILKGYLNILDGILTEGIQTGELKKGLDVRLARQMIFGTIDETVTTWVMNDQKYDLASLSDSVLELLVSGIHNK
ncbi:MULTISPECIES: fatty acid metabolism transcriptional regulator FadR [unclassified Bacillus (in: firmicutes)]|uniref:fatty acid metabolism transcriptional regulator FadR n=1 Tax=unclassified Bacillus (in: firmicutes) TaxID=185979 RepID=UPI0022811678|nr:fatty acid metabolism transcriptional regulator FadR [Bacillus sp. S20C3]MCY8204044.1 fatty acid metabolism transcriptional regulator FadR [Bacillus sp. N12A5]MCY8286912.1 fatty acid metabolism transcriptional regulator FadR [Bacillus sp. N13C7]MCY8637293.1 fatty acid metabolism transcriptional regulator FadR [Bacillus sp. S17B2]MCY8719720.1 fatty acid metabolism transcriptional regulator FadR [Bacillus sp. S10C12M]MCY9143642.1 fatty acid metabolism transcriptional regulator FadR [Bacillus 